MATAHTAIDIGRLGGDDDDGEDGVDALPTFPLLIRFTDRDDLAIDRCPRHATVAWLQERVLTEHADLRDKVLRFVYRGSVLEPGATMAQASVKRGAVILCAASEPSATTNEQRAEGRIVPVLGFDRLRQAGFSDDDIANFRAQFHASNPSWLDDIESMQQREEEWIGSFVASQQTFADELAADGMYRDTLTGLLIGFLFSILVLLFFQEGFFTRRQQVGLISGVALNVAFGLLLLH